MAKPSWVSVSPQSSSGNKTVSVGVTANGGTSNRSGTITITGIISGGTITKTVTITQTWGATVRTARTSGPSHYAGPGQYFNISSIEDNQDISADISGAAILQLSYPYMGGSNICHYSCEKRNGVFYFELNKIQITTRNTPAALSIDDEYWDLSNALFVQIASTGDDSYYFTPVIRFSYTPGVQNPFAVIATLYSLGGAKFRARIESDYYPTPRIPDLSKVLRTGVVGSESEGYGAMYCYFYDSDEGGSVTHRYMFPKWYPVFVETSSAGSVNYLDVLIQAHTIGEAINVPFEESSYSVLSAYNWATIAANNKLIYTQIDLQRDRIYQAVNFPGADMETFYHPEMYYYNSR